MTTERHPSDTHILHALVAAWNWVNSACTRMHCNDDGEYERADDALERAWNDAVAHVSGASPGVPLPSAWLWVNPDGSKEVTFIPPDEDQSPSTVLALSLGRIATPLYEHANWSTAA